MAPTTGKQWTVTQGKEFAEALQFQSTAAVSQLAADEVLVRMHNASLNYRDLIIAKVNNKTKQPLD